MFRRILAIVLGITVPLAAQTATTQPAATQPAVAGPKNFCFVQVTDSHISPHPASLGKTPATRGKAAIDWFCAEAAKPQVLEPFSITMPPPSFAIHTGDLTEYGVIDETWKDFEAAFAALPVPLYVVPGNHDHTWVAMYPIMREKYAGQHYSFDQFGCHFVGLNTAGPQEPLPVLDFGSLWWLHTDLKKVGPNRPVFLFFHHPPDSEEFAQPSHWALLYEIIRPYNVVLMLYGHGHNVRHGVFDGIDGVMGGVTYGDNAGYNIISVKDGTLRVAYRYYNAAKPMVKLLEKPLKKPPASKLAISRPTEKQIIQTKSMEVRLTGKAAKGIGKGKDASGLELTVDGKPVVYQTVGGGKLKVSVAGMSVGGHTLMARTKGAKGKAPAAASVRFFIDDGSVEVPWQRWLLASIKARPLIVDNLLILAGTDGKVHAWDRKSTGPRWELQTGGEILSAPTHCDGLIFFGSGDGFVYAVNTGGKVLWKYEAGAPVYGWPLVADGTVYIGDNSGRFHAIDAKSGAKRWMFERATYSIESCPAIHGDSVLFGAWDGYLYCVNRKDGSLRWKAQGPKSSEGKAARYYAPADCGPIVLGDRVVVCDRGYLLGAYGPDGKPIGFSAPEGEPKNVLAKDVSAIGLAAGGNAFYARGRDDRLVKLDAQGKTLWEASVPAGRFPVPPTEHDGKVYLCSNTGMLSVLSADTGKLVWDCQVTSGFYVMAAVTVDDEGFAYVVGMDGSICKVRKAAEAGQATDAGK